NTYELGHLTILSIENTKRHRFMDYFTELRLLIQSTALWKGDLNIDRLRNENSARINLPNCLGPEHVLKIEGPKYAILKVTEEVMESLVEAMNKGHLSDARMLVHQSQAGCVLGKGGQTIKNLTEECGVKIKVYKTYCPKSTDRVIQIIGYYGRICNTIARVLDLLKETPVKGVNNPYNPRNFDELLADEYGGWGERSKDHIGHPMGRTSPPNVRTQGLMGHRPLCPPGPRPNGPLPFGDRGLLSPADSGLPLMRGHHDAEFYGMRVPPKGEAFRNENVSLGGDFPTTSVQVTVPKGVVGAIIGKGGSRIRMIRSDSGASITIEDLCPGASEQIISITGSNQQIGQAQDLLQQTISCYAPGTQNINLKIVSGTNSPETTINNSGPIAVPVANIPRNVSIQGNTRGERKSVSHNDLNDHHQREGSRGKELRGRRGRRVGKGRGIINAEFSGNERGRGRRRGDGNGLRGGRSQNGSLESLTQENDESTCTILDGNKEDKGITSWSYYHLGDVEIPEICVYSIENRCQYEKTGCKRLHAKCACHWQMNYNEKWINFRLFQSRELEESFQDPGKNECSITPFDTKMVEHSSRDMFKILGVEMWEANFKLMLIINDSHSQAYKIRRLSTHSSAISNSAKATVFEWYFVDKNNKWTKYGNTDSTGNINLTSNVSSNEIEKHFIINGKSLFKFKNADFEYELDFS
ncbi:unnamed protein product, partial [Meganyctiphanes norvegica]